jgi:chromosome segregation ATPase
MQSKSEAAMGGHAGGCDRKRKGDAAKVGGVCDTCGKSSKRTKATADLEAAGREDSESSDDDETKKVRLVLRDAMADEKLGRTIRDKINPEVARIRIGRLVDDARTTRDRMERMCELQGLTETGRKAAKDQVDALEAELATTKESTLTEVAEWRARVGRRDETIKVVNSKVQEQRRTVDAKDREIRRRGVVIDSQSETLRKSADELMRAKKHTDNLDRTIAGMGTQTATRDKEMGEMQLLMGQMRTHVATRDREMGEMQLQMRQIRMTSADADQQTQKRAFLQAENTAMRLRCQLLEEDATAWNAKSQTLEAQLDSLKSRLAAQDAQLAANDVGLTGLAKDNRRKDSQLATQKVVVGELLNKVETKDAQLETKDAQLEAKDAGLEAHAAGLAGLVNDKRRINSELTFQKMVVVGLLNKVETKDAQLEAKDAQLEAKDAQLETKDAQLEAKDAQLAVVDAEHTKTKVTLQAVESELKEADLPGVIGRMQRFQKSFRDKDEKIAGLQTLLADKDQSLAAKDTLLADKDSLLAAKDEDLATKDGLVTTVTLEAQALHLQLAAVEKDLIVKASAIKMANERLRTLHMEGYRVEAQGYDDDFSRP